MTEAIVLTIEKLAGLGDGVGQLNGQRIFVPYTLPGDVVRVRIGRKSKEVTYADLEEIITPGEGRISPMCKHFAVCGGCALQHVSPEIYLNFKQGMAREAVRKAGFDPGCVEPLIRIAPASRRRVELKVADGRLGYYAQHSHALVDIEECKVLEPALEALIMRLKPRLVSLPCVTGVQLNGVDEGYDIVLTGENVGEWQVINEKEIRRISVREGATYRTLYQSGPVTVTLGEVRVEVPPGAFLQASREAQAVMTQRVLAAVGRAKHVLDLFAGIGTYGFALAPQVRVTAVEGDAGMVKAMQQAAATHKLEGCLRATRRDLFVNPLDTFDGIDTVIINPPRTGAAAQILALAHSRVKTLVMISCNPATFARDARILREGGYWLNKALPVDQFVYTSHLEIMAEFSK